MKGFKAFYDEEQDILYLAKGGQEEQFLEIAPGVNAELDKSGELIGIEIFEASKLLKNVLKPIQKKLRA